MTTGGGVDKEDFITSDLSWHCNDTLFDRYFLSGTTSEFTIDGSGYVPEPDGMIEDRLIAFYGDDHTEAEASPVMLPYVPAGKKVDEIVAELDPDNADDSYKKLRHKKTSPINGEVFLIVVVRISVLLLRW